MVNNSKPKVHKQSKYFTIMLVPHSSGRTRSLRIPLMAFYMVLGILAVSLICFVSFVVAAGHFRNAAESAYWDLEQSSEVNSNLNKEKLDLSKKLNLEKRDAEKTIEEQRESYEEIIKNYDTYYDEKVNELEQKLEELNKAKEDIYNILSQKSYLPEIQPVADMGVGAKAVFLSTGSSGYTPDIGARLETLDKEVDDNLVYFDYLIGEMDKVKPYLDNYPTRWPVWGIVTSEHSYRANPFSNSGSEYHEGVDIAADTGTNVRATGGGRVIYADWYSSYGYMVNISHGFGIVTRYAHNSELLVEVGDYVERGDVIAKSGNTGRSTGPHVHYEVIVNGVSVNPRNYIE